MTGRWMRRLAICAAAMGFPALAMAQSQCAIPDSLSSPRAEYPPPGAASLVPLTGYTLALSWSPQFCKEHRGDKKHAAQCGPSNHFGFILHGLWPDGEGQSNPQWCKRVPAVPVDVLRANFCTSPSAALMAHEWAKHGSCVASDAAEYFKAAKTQYDRLKFPDMTALSRSQIDVATLVAAFVSANPGLTPAMIAVDVTPLGWLEEVRLCLGRDYRPRACPRDIGGAGAGTKLKIWRSN